MSTLFCSGLCQAKIAAAELWRTYSENYKSHQARYPNPKNKYRQKRLDRQLSNPEHGTDMIAQMERDGVPFKIRRQSSECDPGRPGMNGVDGDDVEDVDMEDPACIQDEYRALTEGENGLGMLADVQDRTTDRTVDTVPTIAALRRDSPRPVVMRDSPRAMAIMDSPCPAADHSPSLLLTDKSCVPPKAASISPCASEPDFHGRVSSRQFSPDICSSMTSSASYDAAVSTPESTSLCSSTHDGIAASDMFFNGKQKQQLLQHQQQPEYKRSERGLSYLFPSLNDQKLSLLDKVWITVVRHKNNYFLGWHEDTLAPVDPLIRPKMVVTAELYREYCHRNAMKYDSNLQFCMESPEPWACEFREKLRRAPCQGGFGSLCEVKLEAGRLWREYSGKYRMHNIVKWHMDMNNMTTSGAAATDGSVDVEQQKGDVKSESPVQSAATFSPEPAGHVDLPGHNAAMLVEVDLTKKQNHVYDDSPVQPSRGPSSAEMGPVKCPVATCTPTIVRPSTSLNSSSDNLHTSPSIPADSDSTDDGSSMQLDSLFRPLPKNLSVFEQMCVWLERHRRNYFVGYSPGELAQLEEHLRPQMFVTKEVFEKTVSESMIDVLNKVDTIMRCDESWARVYQEKLRSFDGGFVSFEEALTQAVILWATRQPSASQSSAKLYSKQDRVHSIAVTTTETPTGNGNSSLSAVTRMSPSQLTGVIRTRPQYQSSSGCVVAVTAPVDSSSENGTRNYAITENATNPPCERETATVALKSGAVPGPVVADCSHTTSVITAARARKVASPIDAIWQCQAALRTVCADDPCRSWEQRLQPCLPTLRQVLGADYRCPERLSDCMVDLLLATIHQRLLASEVGHQANS